MAGYNPVEHRRLWIAILFVESFDMLKKPKSKKYFLLHTFVPAISYVPEKMIPFIPLPFVRMIGHCLFILLYPIAVLTGLRNRFAVNIAGVFQRRPSDMGIKRIARHTIHNWIMNITEIYHFYHPRNKAKLAKVVSIEGLEKINRIIKNGSGVIGVSGHFGNFPLMILRFNCENLNMSYLFKEVEQESIAKAMKNYINKLNLKMIPTGNNASPSARAIKEIEGLGFVIFIADEFKAKGGVKVEFFGKPTRQAVGPSIISLKTNAPLLPVFIIRTKKNQHKITVGDPIHYVPTGDTNQDIRRLTEKRMEIIENFIKQYPDQWLWVHSRWTDKNSPSK